MKKVYIVLTYTGTILSRVVRLYTRKEYCHVSISLDKDLNQMYSFGRLNPYIPFLGGFVQESPKYGTFKRFKNTKSKIFSLDVSDEEYLKIKSTIEDISKNREVYKFNVMGLITVMGHYHLKRDKCFYCAEFVKHVLNSSDLGLDLPDVIKPEDFQKVNGMDLIYIGRLSEYNTL